MKALTLWQPHASLVALGIKWLETRSWQTDYRGKLAIHAGARFPRPAQALCKEPAFRWALRSVKLPLPRGVVIATVELVNCYRVDELMNQLEFGGELQSCDLATQFPFGDFSEGRFIWHFRNARMLPKPVPAKGALSLWEWEENAR